MPVTDNFYGSRSLGAGRTIRDFGLCNLKGQYVYTTKARAKGLLVVVFFSPDSPPSVRALEAVEAWTREVPMDKWSAIAVATAERDALTAFAERRGIENVTIVIDYEFYQTRLWGISNLPSIFLVDGKTGRTLHRVIGDDAGELAAARQTLSDQIAKLVAAEEAAKEAARKAEEEKKAAEAAKPAEPAKK